MLSQRHVATMRFNAASEPCPASAAGTNCYPRLETGWDCHQTCLVTLASVVLITVSVTHTMTEYVANMISTQAC